MKICKIFFGLIVVFSFLTLCGCGNYTSDSIEQPSISTSKIGSYYQQGVKTPYYEREPEYYFEGVKKPWLFFVYIAGDNDDIKYNQLANLDSLEAVGSDNNTHIVTYIDIGNPKKQLYDWNSSEWSKTIDWTGARGYYITKNSEEYIINSPVITEYGQVNSGSKDFFATCLKEAMTKFPADNICVVVNDHGGAYDGLLYDYSEGTIMSNNDLKEAIKEAEEATGKRINILGFDACLMANIESSYEYKDITDYIIASEELTSVIGWHYEEILDSSKSKGINEIKANSKFGILPRVTKLVQNKYEQDKKKLEEENSSDRLSKISYGVTPSQFAQLIFDATQPYKDEIMVFSIIDTSKLEDVKNTVNDFAKSVIATDKENLLHVIDNIILNPQDSDYYALEYGMWGYYLFDLYTMMDMISSCSDITDQKIKTSAQNVKNSILKAIISNTNSGDIYEEYAYSYGLSILFTFNVNNISLDFERYQNLSFIKNTKWFDMLEKIEEVYTEYYGGSYEEDEDEIIIIIE